MKCPRCSVGRMQERRRKSDGNPFYGCSEYPRCKLTMQPAAYRKLAGLPPETLEEEAGQLSFGADNGGQAREKDLQVDFWGQSESDDDFAGIEQLEPGREIIPEKEG